MIGDAPGDRKAAEANRVALLPDRSRVRRRVVAAVLRRGPAPVLCGDLRGGYRNEQIARFEKLLPESPPWKSA